MLPKAGRPITHKPIDRAKPWSSVPPLLVIAAFTKSVPPTVAGCTPKTESTATLSTNYRQFSSQSNQYADHKSGQHVV